MNNLKAERTLTAEELQKLREDANYLLGFHGEIMPMDPEIVKAMASMALQSLSTQQPMGEVTEGAVATAMREAWDDICSDTGCHPVDIEHLGGTKLQFNPNHWARFTAMYLNSVALHPNQEGGE